MQKTLRLFSRYLGAGCIATLVHALVFSVLLEGLGAVIAALCAGISGALVAYCLARRWVFLKRQCNRWKFAITAISQVVSNTLIVALLVKWGVHPYVAQTAAIAAVTVQGFTINHLWVFKHDVQHEPSQ